MANQIYDIRYSSEAIVDTLKAYVNNECNTFERCLDNLTISKKIDDEHKKKFIGYLGKKLSLFNTAPSKPIETGIPTYTFFINYSDAMTDILKSSRIEDGSLKVSETFNKIELMGFHISTSYFLTLHKCILEDLKKSVDINNNKPGSNTCNYIHQKHINSLYKFLDRGNFRLNPYLQPVGFGVLGFNSLVCRRIDFNFIFKTDTEIIHYTLEKYSYVKDSGDSSNIKKMLQWISENTKNKTATPSFYVLPNMITVYKKDFNNLELNKKYFKLFNNNKFIHQEDPIPGINKKFIIEELEKLDKKTDKIGNNDTPTDFDMLLIKQKCPDVLRFNFKYSVLAKYVFTSNSNANNGFDFDDMSEEDDEPLINVKDLEKYFQENFGTVLKFVRTVKPNKTSIPKSYNLPNDSVRSKMNTDAFFASKNIPNKIVVLSESESEEEHEKESEEKNLESKPKKVPEANAKKVPEANPKKTQKTVKKEKVIPIVVSSEEESEEESEEKNLESQPKKNQKTVKKEKKILVSEEESEESEEESKEESEKEQKKEIKVLKKTKSEISSRQKKSSFFDEALMKSDIESE